MGKEAKVICDRRHWLFSIEVDGIVIKCRKGKCSHGDAHVVQWGELDILRLQAEQPAARPDEVSAR